MSTQHCVSDPETGECNAGTPPAHTPGKWEGWATTTYDGPGDATGRFCGELLDGVPNDGILNAGV